MARAQDAQTITGGGVDPYVQQSLMQNKQLASNRLVAAMQESGATQRQQMAGQQQMEQQKLAGEQAMARTAAETAAEDRRAADAERGRREDREEQKRQFDETQTLTARLADRQFVLEKAIDERDFERAGEYHAEIMADQRLQRIMEADRAEEAMKVMVGSLEFQMGELAAEKEQTILTEIQEKTNTAQSTHEQMKSRIKENFLSDNRFDIFIRPEADLKAAFRGPFAQIAVGGEGAKELWEHRSASVRDAIQRQSVGNKSNISVEDLKPSGFASLEQKVAAGKIKDVDIRMMYTTLEAAKEAVREKLTTASDREAKEWNAQSMMIDNYEATLEGLKSSTRKIVGNENQTVGMVARTGLDVVQGSGTTEVIDRMKVGLGTKEERIKAFLANIKEAKEPSSRRRKEYPSDADKYLKRAIDDLNRSRGFDISAPGISIREDTGFTIVGGR